MPMRPPNPTLSPIIRSRYKFDLSEVSIRFYAARQVFYETYSELIYSSQTSIPHTTVTYLPLYYSVLSLSHIWSFFILLHHESRLQDGRTGHMFFHWRILNHPRHFPVQIKDRAHNLLVIDPLETDHPLHTPSTMGSFPQGLDTFAAHKQQGWVRSF